MLMNTNLNRNPFRRKRGVKPAQAQLITPLHVLRQDMAKFVQDKIRLSRGTR